MQEVEDIGHEIVNTVTRPEPVDVINEDINRELKKFNIADAAIEQMKQNYSGLKILGIDDRDGWKKVDAAWREVRNVRLAIEKKHKVIKADYLTISRAIDGEKNRLVGLVQPLENELGAELDKIEQERQAVKEQREREEYEKLQGRVNTLTENGMSFNGSFYVIGESVSMDVVTLKNLSDTDFNGLLLRVQLENSKIVEARKAEEDRQREEAERFKREQEEVAAERKRQAEQAEELQKQRQQMISDRRALRIEVLKNLGFVHHDKVKMLLFTLPVGAETALYEDFENLDGDKWDALFHFLKKKVNDLAKAQAEADQAEADRKAAAEKRQKEELELRARTAARRKELLTNFYFIEEANGDLSKKYSVEGGAEYLRVSFEDIVNTEDIEWPAFFECVKGEHEDLTQRQDEHWRYEKKREEEKRQARLTDYQKAKEYFNALAAVPTPEVNDRHVFECLADIQKRIKSACIEFE